jgi:hypothetical protein
MRGGVLSGRSCSGATKISGMALAPAFCRGTEWCGGSIRVSLCVNDRTERGEFSGERTETITYLFERAGSYVLPAQKFTWWNPDDQSLRSKVLPIGNVEVRGSRATTPSSPAR